MRVLFVEPHADGLLDIAMRAKAAGHDVRYFLRDYDPQKCPVGRGLVERVADFRSSLRWADLIVLGANDYCMIEFDRARAEGARIIGGGVESARWEGDRLYGMAMFKKAGIPIPPCREFTDYVAAIRYVEREGRAFASKPCWDGADKSLSYVGKTPEDLVYMLDRWRRKWGRPKGPFILQEKIAGIEFAVGAWFGPDGFVDAVELNWEEKKLFPGGLGPATGEMGTTMLYVRDDKLAQKVLAPLEPLLARLGYVGNIDVNCIVDEDGTPWPLEFTMRCGWPSTNIEMEMFDCDPVEFWHGLATGKVPRRHHKLNQAAVGVVCALPDFPYSHTTRKDVVGIPVWGLAGDAAEHWHPAQMMADGEQPQTAGDYIGIMAATGDSVQAARAGAYRRLKRLEIPASPFWRIDIGQRLRGDLPKLQQHGYVRGLDYA